MDLYLFDFDKTLYAYDNRYRLPALARATGVTQYRLAKSWWAAGYETRAESGEWPDAESYLDAFAEVTGGRRLSLDEWADARRQAMTRNDVVVGALQDAARHGAASLLSNNPSVFAAAVPQLAPEVVEALDGRILTSCALGVRKPDPRAFELTMAQFDATPARTFFVDDSASNVAGALALGIRAHHYAVDSPSRDDDLLAAIERFRETA